MRYKMLGISISTALLIGACSNEAIYDTAQQNHALECQKYPDSRYEDCMRTVEKSYDEYEQDLNEASTEGESRQ